LKEEDRNVKGRKKKEEKTFILLERAFKEPGSALPIAPTII